MLAPCVPGTPRVHFSDGNKVAGLEALGEQPRLSPILRPRAPRGQALAVEEISSIRFPEIVIFEEEFSAVTDEVWLATDGVAAIPTIS